MTPRTDGNQMGETGIAPIVPARPTNTFGSVTSRPGSDRTFTRWKALALTDPVAKVIRAGAHAQLDDYDLRQLAVRCIDLVVANQGDLDAELSVARLVDLLTDAARTLHPNDPERRWAKVAQHVLAGLLNTDAGEQFNATYTVTGNNGAAPVAHQFRFRLLELKDGVDTTRVVATDEAIMLYLQALEVDLTDQQAALTVMMQRQMEAGKFDRARLTARQALDTARSYTTLITEAIDDTRRDLGVVDWAGDMPVRLRDALDHVTEQVGVEDRLLALARAGAEATDDTITADCSAIEADVWACRSAHVRLEQRLNQAIPTFLDAQEDQRLRARNQHRSWRPVTDIIAPALAATPTDAVAVCDAFADAAVGFTVRPVGDVDAVVAALLRAPQVRSDIDGDIDVPVQLVDVASDTLDPKVAHIAAEVFHTATTAPRRLSELLATIGDHVPFDTDIDPTDVADIVWAGALWLFVSPHGAADDGERLTGDLADVLSILGADRDGRVLDHPRYVGDDLLIATRPEGNLPR